MTHFVSSLHVMLQCLLDCFVHAQNSDQVVTYTCVADEKRSETNRHLLKLDDTFASTVMNFFKKKINEQYPPLTVEEDITLRSKKQHEAFMIAKAHSVLSRDNILREIEDYINGERDVPLLITGSSGSGKSSILAAAVRKSLTNHEHRTVFYHFVGAVPLSTSLSDMLQRLLMDLCDAASEPIKLDDAVDQVRLAMFSDTTRPAVIFVDAVNQFDASHAAAELVSWLPEKLAPQVRCVLSMIEDSTCHRNLLKRESKPQKIPVTTLQPGDRKQIVETYFRKYNKELIEDQMSTLLKKEFSHNPLWLVTACEELRVFGDFRKVGDKIEKLAVTLDGLLEQVIKRLAREGDGHLVRATLCLLEVSKSGLLETELLDLLGDEANLIRKRKTNDGLVMKGRKGFHLGCGRLPAMKWAGVYCNLRIFLRPFGNPREGRLDFYHQSLSKIVRKIYLRDTRTTFSTQSSTESASEVASRERRYRWWHQKLADYFKHVGDFERKIQEYPYHLIKLKRTDELEEFLLNWKAFDLLYNDEHSDVLLYYWRQCRGGYTTILEKYAVELEKEEAESKTTDDILDAAAKYEKVSRLLVQAGRLNDAENLAHKSLHMVQSLSPAVEDLSSRYMYLYGHLAHLETQKLPAKQDVSQIPLVENIIQYHEKAIEILKRQKGKTADKKTKSYLAVQLMKKGFACGTLVDRLRRKISVDQSAVTEKLEMARRDVSEAETILVELGDVNWMIEALLTKATLFRKEFGQQHKIYDETLKLCRERQGPINPTMAKLYFNKAIVYEDEAMETDETETYGRAYDYYKKAYVVSREALGVEHSRTARYRGVLAQDTYVWFSDRRKENIDALVTEQVLGIA